MPDRAVLIRAAATGAAAEGESVTENQAPYRYDTSVTAHLLIRSGRAVLLTAGPGRPALPEVSAGPDRSVEAALAERLAELVPVPPPGPAPELVRVVEWERTDGPVTRHALHLVFRLELPARPAHAAHRAPAGHHWARAAEPTGPEPRGPAGPLWRFTTDPAAVDALIAPELHPF